MVLAVLLSMGLGAFAQETAKWDGVLDNMLQNRSRLCLKSNRIQALKGSDGVNVIVRATDAQPVVEELVKAGYEATYITSTLLTANVPLQYVPTLAEIKGVEYVNSSKQYEPFCQESRAVSNVDAVHKGTGLETPYTGKGVVVAVIDQGFQFRHAAFLDSDGETRVKWLWNRGQASGTNPTSTIPDEGDRLDGGHATHVTNIACGSKLKENKLYGMAPDADIYMISSTFDDKEVLEDVAWIKKTAEASGQPWVVNMSFGGTVGPHDGSTDYCQGVSALLGPGGLCCAAMGNEGDSKLHAMWKTTKNSLDEYYLLLNPIGDEQYSIVDLWGQAPDGKRHFTVTPLICSGGSVREMTSAEINKCCAGSYNQIDANNKKEHYYYQVIMAYLRQVAGSNTAKFALRITCREKGQTIHAWNSFGRSEFQGSVVGKYNFKAGDNQYLVGEGAATIPRAISVSSYNTGTEWKGPNGAWYSYPSVGETGAISNFSSRGPYLSPEGGDNEQCFKPTVAAPGATILSAVSSFDPKFNAKDATICNSFTRNGQTYYFSAMTGTSMASPACAGILALWLQANPKLTPEDCVEIFDKTAMRDDYTGGLDLEDIYSDPVREENYHSNSFGSGKIDAYEGLKMAIKMRPEGINDIHNSREPLTINKKGRAWQILFNNHESFAKIRVYNTAGQLMKQLDVTDAKAGQEKVLDMQGLPSGVYMVKVVTEGSESNSKVVVK